MTHFQLFLSAVVLLGIWTACQAGEEHRGLSPNSSSATIPAGPSSDSEEAVEAWLRQPQNDPPLPDPTPFKGSLYVVVVIACILALVGCFAWWKRNVDREERRSKENA